MSIEVAQMDAAGRLTVAIKRIAVLKEALEEIAEHPGVHADEAAWKRVEIAKDALAWLDKQ
jgi:hypothetical protein